jgi:hypothetical protein
MKSIRKNYWNRIEYHNEYGQRHRTDGPALEWNDGVKAWYINGELHREDGHVREWSFGYREWYLNGEFYSSEEEWKQEVTKIKLKRILDL